MRLRKKIMLLAIFVFAFPFVALANDAEVYVVATDDSSNNYYMRSNDDGTFSDQEDMGRPDDFMPCYGNGIGDFDNDGDFDYIQAVGSSDTYPQIYLYEKLGNGNDFAEPAVIGVWTQGYYPMDMPVGDFDEDGNLDFILTHYGSNNSELYLGNGDLTFSAAIILENTTSDLALGADIADFNNDGHADFVSAEWGGSSLYINLGNGDGTFDTITQELNTIYWYWGVTAADFDSDGNVDLLTTENNYLDFYKGNGDGYFTFNKSIEVDYNTYPIDNYDFDGDGRQDFVVGREEHVDVFLNIGIGSADFLLENTYSGGSGNYRLNISAPSSAPPYVQNVEPVAVAEPYTQEVTAGDAAIFDGYGSYDDDGDIISYVWDFGDSSEPIDDPTPSHVYHNVGVYTVTLTVTDNKGATDSTEVEVYVSAIPVSIDVMPKTINLKSKGNWISVAISLPPDYDATQIDLKTVGIRSGDSGLIMAINNPKYGFVSNIEGNNMLRVKFDRAAVADAVPVPADETMLYVVGKIFYNGNLTDFEGFDIIRTIMNGK